MVKVVFIVEGKVEKLFIDFLERQNWFSSKGIQKIGPTIDARGGGNLCAKNLPVFIEQARTHNPDKIVVLTDQECDPCVQQAKERIGECGECVVILAKRAIEAWFLADNQLISTLTEQRCTQFPANPESTSRMPYDLFKVLAKRLKIRGPGSSKVIFAKKVFKNGFEIERSAQRAPSADYFIRKMKAIGERR